jgi:hypothetical protein
MSTEWRNFLVVAFIAFACWIAALSALAYRADPGDQVAVWVPPKHLWKVISASSVSVIDAGPTGFVVLRGDAPGFVASLYTNGAWLVLPVRGPGGCVPSESRT